LSPPGSILIPHERAAENVKGAADGQIDFAAGKLLYPCDVVQMARTTGVGRRQTDTFAEQAYQVFINSQALAFDIGSMNQELGAKWLL
jgi:hypothetical protein